MHSACHGDRSPACQSAVPGLGHFVLESVDQLAPGASQGRYHFPEDFGEGSRRSEMKKAGRGKGGGQLFTGMWTVGNGRKSKPLGKKRTKSAHIRRRDVVSALAGSRCSNPVIENLFFC